MTVFAVACLIIAVVLAVLLIRSMARVGRLEQTLRTTEAERDERAAEARAARDDAVAARRQVDDAHERVQRARRDAADVATRLRDESEARNRAEADLAASNEALEDARAGQAESNVALEGARAALAASGSELEEARAELDRSRADLADARRAPTSQPVDVEAARFGEELWALTLRDVENTWRISVALGADTPSPLVDADNAFEAAVEVEVDAAREESGAELELHWGDDPVEPPAECAVLALALVRDVIAALGTTAARTDLTVCTSSEAVDVRVAAVGDDGNDVDVWLPRSLTVAPGHARVSAS